MKLNDVFSGALKQIRIGMVENIINLMKGNNIGMISLFDNGASSDFDFGIPYAMLHCSYDAFSDVPQGSEIVAVAVSGGTLLVLPNNDNLSSKLVDVLENDRYFPLDLTKELLKDYSNEGFMNVEDTLCPTDTLLKLQSVIEQAVEGIV